MVSQRSLANLRPFPKGTSGNPGGRPKDGLLAKIRAELDRPSGVVEDGVPHTRADVIANILVTLAEDGDLDAIKLVLAYTEGRPVQAVEHGGQIAHAVTVSALRKALGVPG
jgi:hypothetical protein